MGTTILSLIQRLLLSSLGSFICWTSTSVHCKDTPFSDCHFVDVYQISFGVCNIGCNDKYVERLLLPPSFPSLCMCLSVLYVPSWPPLLAVNVGGLWSEEEGREEREESSSSSICGCPRQGYGRTSRALQRKLM